ncbi:hypothetical protein D9M73_103420 [compost metagenome]
MERELQMHLKLVTSLPEYQNRGLIAALEEFLVLAKTCDMTGLAVVGKFGKHDHRAYVFGDYKRNPHEALTATFHMESMLMNGFRAVGS